MIQKYSTVFTFVWIVGILEAGRRSLCWLVFNAHHGSRTITGFVKKINYNNSQNQFKSHCSSQAAEYQAQYTSSYIDFVMSSLSTSSSSKVTFDFIEIIEMNSPSPGGQTNSRMPLHRRAPRPKSRRTIVDLEAYEVSRMRRQGKRDHVSSSSSSSTARRMDSDEQHDEMPCYARATSPSQEAKVPVSSLSSTTDAILMSFDNVSLDSHEELILAIDDEVLRLSKKLEEISSRIGNETTTKKGSACPESPPQSLNRNSLEQNEEVARCA